MRTDITCEQIESYRENGYLFYENLLNSTEVEAITNAVLASVDQMGKNKVAGNEGHMEEGETFYDKVFLQRLNLWKINDTIKATFLDPKLGELMCELEGIDGIRVWHDQTLMKAPWANHTAFHVDNPYWSFDSHHAISIWVALQDVTPENGGLYFLPGTHKKCDFRALPIGENMDEVFKMYPEFADIEPVSLNMKAGDCTFHNGLLVHGAGPNMTPRWRRAMTCAYMPEGSTFNGKHNILDKEYAESLNLGDEINDESRNPLLYQKQAVACI